MGSNVKAPNRRGAPTVRGVPSDRVVCERARRERPSTSRASYLLNGHARSPSRFLLSPSPFTARRARVCALDILISFFTSPATGDLPAKWTARSPPITIEIDLDRKKSLSGNSTRPTAPLKPSPTRVGAHSCTRNRLKTHSSSRPSLRTEKMAAMTVSMTGVRASATPTTRRARIGSRQVAPSAFRRSAVATGRRSNSLVVGPRPLT